MEQKLLIGKIPFTNLFPIFHVLQNVCDCKDYELVEGYPSDLNRMLRHGEIEVSPSSSIEYLRDTDGYTFIDGHSISSAGPVESILLFSRRPIESLDGHEVFVTHRSETSTALLNIIFREFYKIRCDLKVTGKPTNQALYIYPAYLSIGDEALLTANRAQKVHVDITGQDYRLCTIDHNVFYIYDLGDLWYKNTGLPFVFALWIAKKNLPEAKRILFEKFKDDLDRSKHLAMKNLPHIAKVSGLPMHPDKLVKYWNRISYDFKEEHGKGLQLFGEHLRKLDLLTV